MWFTFNLRKELAVENNIMMYVYQSKNIEIVCLKRGFRKRLSLYTRHIVTSSVNQDWILQMPQAQFRPNWHAFNDVQSHGGKVIYTRISGILSRQICQA
jgi:hypothetical protein